MAITVDENILLSMVSVVFIPLLILLVKMIMEVSNNKARLSNLEESTKEHIEMNRRISKLENEEGVKRVRIDNLERWLDRRFGGLNGSGSGSIGGGSKHE